MHRIAIVLPLALSLLFAGCASPDVRYADLHPPTTATGSGDTITIHVGSDLVNSACYTQPKARVKGHTVYVVGYRSLREQGREYVIRLPGSVSSESVSVIWVDPDGTRHPIPPTK
jgi:hypothetical protein